MLTTKSVATLGISAIALIAIAGVAMQMQMPAPTSATVMPSSTAPIICKDKSKSDSTTTDGKGGPLANKDDAKKKAIADAEKHKPTDCTKVVTATPAKCDAPDCKSMGMSYYEPLEGKPMTTEVKCDPKAPKGSFCFTATIKWTCTVTRTCVPAN
jgi:hypothetical protein